eukprot:CAMPEP_0171061944 /NCGR_PEP_ID=MMETSP0766_2-20121228/4765_1 /TAXON_ID=439317 /ORGANISM="Gambierdiscus australes, Strain CAWD 149" /LENGTH=150 /DNA_ID=CAMNT_0011517695 /DNA_START=59 /DNA_END=511 /DNA_ORIENTATION=+
MARALTILLAAWATSLASAWSHPATNASSGLETVANGPQQGQDTAKPNQDHVVSVPLSSELQQAKDITRSTPRAALAQAGSRSRTVPGEADQPAKATVKAAHEGKEKKGGVVDVKLSSELQAAASKVNTQLPGFLQKVNTQLPGFLQKAA